MDLRDKTVLILGGAGPDEVWRGLATVAGSWIGGARIRPP